LPRDPPPARRVLESAARPLRAFSGAAPDGPPSARERHDEEAHTHRINRLFFAAQRIESPLDGVRCAVALRAEVLEAIEEVKGRFEAAVASYPQSLELDEVDVRMRQLAMWQTVEAGILPTWRHLAEADERDGLKPLAVREEYELQRRTGASTHAGSRHMERDPRTALARALGTDGRDAYLAAWKRVHALADRVAEEFLRVLLPQTRLRWARDHASGSRLDVRRAMEFDQNARGYNRLWLRTVAPTRSSSEFVLLLDRSQSMGEHGRMAGAFDAMVLLVEAARRVGARTSVWSFAGALRQDLAADDALDDVGRRTVGKLLRDADGSTCLHEALYAVREHFARSTATDRVLFVLSDGEPEDERLARSALNELREDGVRCVGLGIGPRTAGVASLFDRARAEVPVERVAEGLRDLLAAEVGVGPNASALAPQRR
jgi:hypothetical protein